VRFVLVNGRTPRPRSLCVECSQPISESYLREFRERQFYCDYECYATLNIKPTTALTKTAREHLEHFDQMKAAELTYLCPYLAR